MFDSIQIAQHRIAPAFFLAPMAGITHAPFRRLVSGFGGYGALYTEMVSSSAFLHEDSASSPFTKRRDCEGPVIYQFRVSGHEDLEAVLAKMEREVPFTAIDLNLGCPAPKIQQQASGAALFRDFPRLKEVLTRIRKVYLGPLMVKCRLGDDPEAWREGFLDRLRLFEDCGVDALTVHPRFSTEKLKRRARWEEFPWIAGRTKLTLIGNGDVCTPKDVMRHPESFAALQGLMLGRVAAVRPWIFRSFAGLPPVEIAHEEVWERFVGYLLEDFPPEKAFGRLMDFAFFFAKNFRFAHQMYTGLQKAQGLDELNAAALGFLKGRPSLASEDGLGF